MHNTGIDESIKWRSGSYIVIAVSYKRSINTLFISISLYIACYSPRGPELTAAVQAPLQLQLNCCHTGSSTASACYAGVVRRGSDTRRRQRACRHTEGLLWAALL